MNSAGVSATAMLVTGPAATTIAASPRGRMSNASDAQRVLRSPLVISFPSPSARTPRPNWGAHWGQDTARYLQFKENMRLVRVVMSSCLIPVKHKHYNPVGLRQHRAGGFLLKSISCKVFRVNNGLIFVLLQHSAHFFLLRPDADVRGDLRLPVEFLSPALDLLGRQALDVGVIEHPRGVFAPA